MIDLKRVVPITCHQVDGVFASHLREFAWRDGRDNRAYGGVEPWRTCSYCGSMHPLDLLDFLSKGLVDLHGADWKYGWPHKFYADVRNPHEGKPSVCGSVGGGMGKSLEEMQAEHPDYENWTGSKETGWHADAKPTPAPATMHGKFYNEHLKDLNDEEFGALSFALAMRCGVNFDRRDGKLFFFSVRGHQAMGRQTELFQKYMSEGADPIEAMRKAAEGLKEEMDKAYAEYQQGQRA